MTTFSWQRFSAISLWILALFLIYVTASEFSHFFGPGEMRRLLFTRRPSDLQLNRRQEAHLAISLGGGYSGGREPWDVALLGQSIELLPTLFVLSRDHTTRIERARHTVMAPNLLCVAGAFSFGLTGLAAVFISNFGTSVVYNNVTRSLRAVDDPVTQWRDTCWFEDAATASDWPNSRLGEGYDMEIHHDQPAA
jgi:hypothetical protein